jgi:hypothetical protein
VIDFNFDVPAPCVAVAGAVGSSCPPGPFATTIDTLVPGTIIEFQRMSYMITDRIVVLDLGPDALGAGVAGCPPTCGTGDESVYRAAGQFTP